MRFRSGWKGLEFGLNQMLGPPWRAGFIPVRLRKKSKIPATISSLVTNDQSSSVVPNCTLLRLTHPDTRSSHLVSSNTRSFFAPLSPSSTECFSSWHLSSSRGHCRRRETTCPGLLEEPRAESSSRRNTLSWRWVYGTTTGLGSGGDRKATDAVARQAAGRAAGASTGVLGGDRSGRLERGRRGRGWRITGGRVALVP